MSERQVLIAGGGIAGLSLALTLHQIGVHCTIFETAREMRPLGVGINLQPNAVRELIDLGIGTEMLDRVGIPAREWALVGLNGNLIHAEPRGLEAGYAWPQYAVHRGRFHMLLLDEVLRRLGPGTIQTGTRVTGFSQDGRSVTAHLQSADGARRSASGALLVGADGIHSAIRATMHPAQPPIHWGGMLMWRGTTRARPIRTGASFVGLGTSGHRVVFYPISPPDADGLSEINWIAEVTMDPGHGWQQTGWFRQVPVADFAHHFEGFRYGWFDMPALLAGAEVAYENPMIDRDPVSTWVDRRVVLVGDAAHAMYPTGSNGASQAIVDGRVLGSHLLVHGLTPEALAAYDVQLCGPVSDLVLRNRGAGPFGMLKLVEDRCGGRFDDIETVLPEAERTAFMAGYRRAAGLAIETLNAAPPTIAPGARVH